MVGVGKVEASTGVAAASAVEATVEDAFDELREDAPSASSTAGEGICLGAYGEAGFSRMGTSI